MKYRIYEECNYEVEAATPQDAIKRFLTEGAPTFPTEVTDRYIADDQGAVCDVDPDGNDEVEA